MHQYHVKKKFRRILFFNIESIMAIIYILVISTINRVIIMKNNQENLYNRIINLQPSFNGLFAKTAHYFINNLDNLKFLRIKQIADNCGVSEATITRFVKALGFTSFYDFKMTIAHYTPKQTHDDLSDFILGDINFGDRVEDIIKKIKSEFINTIDVTIKYIDILELKKAIAVISSAKTINLYATGNSSVSAKYAYLRFYRIGKKSSIYTDPSEMAVSASLLGKDDIAIGISYSGKSEPVTKAIQYAKEAGATTISITGPLNSPLVRTADIKLCTVKSEADDFQISSFSRLSHIIILDIIYAGVAVNSYDIAANAIKVSGEKVRDILNN